MDIKERRNYDSAHRWIRYHYGRANKCEFCGIKTTKRYHWALKKGCKYSRDINDYFQLCSSCHRKYDMTDETKKKMSKSKKGKTAWWRRKHFKCEICSKPHFAKGLCAYHYNKKYYPWKKKDD